MDQHPSFFLLFLLFFFSPPSLLHLPLASAQLGFISIDCGNEAENTYPEKEITWTPDTNLTQGGEAAKIQDKNLLSTVREPLKTVRYFPGNNIRYCYELTPVAPGESYLIRATFLHGNYNGKNTVPITFKLFHDADSFSDVTITNISSIEERQAYVIAQRSYISICLARAGVDDPFISSLELRPLSSSLFSVVAQKKTYTLYPYFHINMGALTDDIFRYPDDPFDRMWLPYKMTPRISSLSTLTSVLPDFPPSAVLQTAFGDSGAIAFGLGGFSQTKQVYIAMFFSEIGNAAVGERVFNVEVNGNKYTGPVDIANITRGKSPSYVVYTDKFFNLDSDTLNITMEKTSTSLRDPIFNAVEIYKVGNNPIKPLTDSGDAQALSSVKDALNFYDSIGDPCTPVEYVYDWLSCSTTIPIKIDSLFLSTRNLTGTLSASLNQLNSLTHIELNNNQLTGGIPDLSNLTKLEALHLQNNNLSGPIPEFLGQLPNLAELYLQNNQFSGSLPQSIQDKISSSRLKVNIEGNNVCSNDSCSPISPPSGAEGTNKGSSKMAVIIAVPLTVGLVAIAAILVFLIYYKKCTHHPIESPVRPNPPIPSINFEDSQRAYSYEEIQFITNHFNKKIASGRFGEVFYGNLHDKTLVAVKVFSSQCNILPSEFIKEVESLMKARHRNVVIILGYCSTPKFVLVSEFMPKGSLQEHLYIGENYGETLITWKTRLSIALEVAQGLEYLHTSCVPSIVHGSIKSSNILLNENMRAKVGDFRLSRIHAAIQNNRDMIPSSSEDDVYDFGVLLLEIIAGRAHMDKSYPQNEVNLIDWVDDRYKHGDIDAVIDERIRDDYGMGSMWKTLEVALSMVNSEPQRRPNMSFVLQGLKEASSMEENDENQNNQFNYSYTGNQNDFQVNIR